MARLLSKDAATRFLAHYGMLFVLILLGAFFSIVTIQEQHHTGAAGARQFAREISRQVSPNAKALIVVRDTREDAEFARELAAQLESRGLSVVETVKGSPAEARQALKRVAESGGKLDIIAASEVTARWTVLEEAAATFAPLKEVKLLYPRSYRWPNFLKAENLLNISNQIAV